LGAAAFAPVNVLAPKTHRNSRRRTDIEPTGTGTEIRNDFGHEINVSITVSELACNIRKPWETSVGHTPLKKGWPVSAIRQSGLDISASRLLSGE